MTPELIELSKQAAEVLGIPQTIYDHNKTRNLVVWLAEDNGRCAEIAADRRISTNFVDDEWVYAEYEGPPDGYARSYEVEVKLADHNGDRKQAWRVAVLKAVIEQEKGN